MHHKWRSYDVWFLRCKAWESFLSFCTTTQKIKILKKWKQGAKLSSFYISTPKIMIIHYILYTMFRRDRCNCYFSFWAIFCHHPTNTWDIIIYTSAPKIMIIDHMIYCSWGMACDTCNCYFLIWAIFCNNPKYQNLKKNKMPRDIIILHMCTKNVVKFLRYGAW